MIPLLEFFRILAKISPSVMPKNGRPPRRPQKQGGTSMANNELQEQELQSIIEQSVDDAVKRAFKKYGRVSWRSLLSPRRLLSFLVILAVLGSGIWLYERNRANEPVAPVEDHDLTLENDGIFGFKAADFEEPILGEATRQRQLIAEEQEVYVNTTITDTGLFNLGVFNKQQALTIHGTGQYTIDLTRLSRRDISLNEQTYELTIRIPHAELHDTLFDPAQTEIGDTKNGWLAFGSIKLDAEQQKAFEVSAVEQLQTKLEVSDRFTEADRFARLAAYELYQPIVRAVSPIYQVIIEFQ